MGRGTRGEGRYGEGPEPVVALVGLADKLALDHLVFLHDRKQFDASGCTELADQSRSKSVQTSAHTPWREEGDRLVDLGEANVEVDYERGEVVIARRRLDAETAYQHGSNNQEDFTSFQVVSNERSSFLHVMMSMNFNCSRGQYHPVKLSFFGIYIASLGADLFWIYGVYQRLLQSDLLYAAGMYQTYNVQKFKITSCRNHRHRPKNFANSHTRGLLQCSSSSNQCLQDKRDQHMSILTLGTGSSTSSTLPWMR
eukprot:457292-Hanusia_phi.AAC.3